MSTAKDSMSGRLVLGRYHIVRPLAQGGMGLVYLGRLEGSAGFAKPVVVKTVLPTSDDEGGAAERFAREARIVSLLRHSGIVSVIDFGRVDTTYVMVLEYVHGFNVAQWARYLRQTRRRIRAEYAVHIALHLLEALEYAHQLNGEEGDPLGIVHRDISTANLLIDVHGQIKLHDFGIARTQEDEYRTQDGSFRGTLPFSPPEALQGEPPNQNFDLYACGVVLYDLLAGKNPFASPEVGTTVYRVLNEIPPSLHAVRDDVSPALARVVDRALAKDPQRRFESATEFLNALRAACPFDESAVAREFARQIAVDFTGDMPRRLALPSLEERNAAWRAAARCDPLDSPRIGPVAISRSQREASRSSSPASGPPKSAAATTKLAGATSRVRGWVLASPRKVAAIAGAAVLLAAGSATFVLTLWQRPAAAPSGTHFLLVEKQAPQSTAAAVSPSSEPLPAAPAGAKTLSATTETMIASESKPLGKSATAERLEPARTRGATLTAALRRQRPGIESCFRTHARALEGTPQISLRFDVNAQGNVRSVTLSPAEIARVPLGQCILSVARSTQFGPREEALTFTIPITAREIAR
jgi:serine/threonine-protein kinase